jgi:hypothetical protein
MELAENEANDSENEHHQHDHDDHVDHIGININNRNNSNAPLSIIGTVAHSRPRSSTYPLDASHVPRPYMGVPARAVPHDSLPPFASSSSSSSSTTSSSTTTSASQSNNNNNNEVDVEQVREWQRIKSMVLSQLLDQSNEVTQLSHHNATNQMSSNGSMSMLGRQFASSGIATSNSNTSSSSTETSTSESRGERELSRGAHIFSFHRPLRRISYDALLNVSIQERNIGLAIAVLDVMSASQYRLSSSMQISLAEMFARSSHVLGALHVLRLSVWGSHARSLPSLSCSDNNNNKNDSNSNDNVTAVPRDVDPNDPV